MSASSPRYESLEVVRLFAALMVLITHCGYYVHERLDSSFVYWQRGAAGVGVFFVLSGVVIVLALEREAGTPHWVTFIRLRLARVLPLYWLTTAAKSAILLVSAGALARHASAELEVIVKSFFFIPSYNEIDRNIGVVLGVGWTLVFEVFFYAVVALCLFFRIDVVFGTSALMLIIALGSIWRADVDPRSNPELYFILNAVVLNFAFGLVLGRYVVRCAHGGFGSATYLTAILTGVLLIIMPGSINVIDANPLLMVGVGSVLLIWGALGWEIAYRPSLPRPLVFLGAASYSLYLVHPLVSPVVPLLMARSGVRLPLVALILSMALAIACAAGSYVLLEKPINQRLRMGIRRKPMPASHT